VLFGWQILNEKRLLTHITGTAITWKVLFEKTKKVLKKILLFTPYS